VVEMAAVMRMAVKLEEEREWEQKELLVRLLTENKVSNLVSSF
jgi:SIKE family